MADGQSGVVVENVGRRYGDFWAVRGVSFRAKPGEIVGVIGPNGAGKSTTLKMVSGLLEPTEGGILVDGLPPSAPAYRSRLGYLPEESPLYEDMTPEAYLRFFADLYEVPRDIARERIERSLLELKLEIRNERRIGDLSKGQRRKVAIARSLVNDPSLLIYDEPASGLDPSVSAHVLSMIGDLRARGKTVIFSAHNLFHVERICDYILVVHRGRVILQGTMKQIREAAGGSEYRVRVSVPLEGTKPVENGFEAVVGTFQEVARIEAQAAAAGGRVLDVRSSELHLEEIFLRATASG